MKHNFYAFGTSYEYIMIMTHSGRRQVFSLCRGANFFFFFFLAGTLFQLTILNFVFIFSLTL